ncbi:MAG TPA: hypothetical protein PLH30_05400 [Bacteroidales bacterium]|nr:hypothetical protein [Bacteroidales bacterium]
MKLIFVNADELDRNVKCSVHKTGKLGFNENAIRKLELDSSKSIKIAYMQEDSDLENIYIEVVSGLAEGAFKIIKAGDYYYLNTKPFFDKLGIDYKNGNIRYEIIDFEHEGIKMYKLTKILIKKRKSTAIN